MEAIEVNLNNTFERDSDFGKNIAVYLMDDKLKSLREILRDRKYTTKDTGVDYRTVSHWRDVKILPKSVDKQEGWKKFTLPEIVWMKVIVQLREYGFPLDKIAKARNEIEWEELKDFEVSILEYYSAVALATTSDPYVLILPDGQAEIATTYEVLSKDFFSNQTDMLMISLKSILKNLGFDVPKANLLHQLTANEEELLWSIRYEDNKEVSMHLSDGAIKELTTVKNYDEDTDSKIKKNGEFAEVVTRYTRGEKRSAEVRVKKRFK